MSQIWQVNTLWQSKKVTPRCTPTAPNQCPYQVSTFYTLWNPRNSPDKILETHGHYDKLKGQIKVTPSCCTPTTPNQYPYQVSNSYTLLFLRYTPDKFLWVKVTTARTKVKSRSLHDVAHLHALTNVPTKYQLPTPYRFRDIAQTRFYRSRSL